MGDPGWGRRGIRGRLGDPGVVVQETWWGGSGKGWGTPGGCKGGAQGDPGRAGGTRDGAGGLRGDPWRAGRPRKGAEEPRVEAGKAGGSGGPGIQAVPGCSPVTR